MGDGNPTLRQVVAEIDAEHTARIEEAKAANPHDEVVMAGSKVAWKEVLIAPFLLHRSTLHCYSVPWQTAT